MTQSLDKNVLKEFTKVASKMNYAQQAQFFLNAFWKEHGKDCEKFWDYVQKFKELDLKNGENGKSLDEVQSARFLEINSQTMTVLERRKALKTIDIDTDNMMSLLEFALWQYKENVGELMSRPQGVSKELEEAEKKINEIKSRIKKMEKYKKKWENQEIPTTGVKKISYENDMKVITDGEKFLEQALDFAKKKLKAAEKSSDTVAQGKIWWVNREYQEALKYKPPPKQKKSFQPKN